MGAPEPPPAEYVFINDTIRLLADIQNYPNGASVSFDIFDCTKEPAFRIGTARGKNDNGTGKAEWKVDDPNDYGEDLILQFNGEVRSKQSERATIDVKALITGGIHLIFENQDGMLLKGVTVTVTDGGVELFSGTADNGEVGVTAIPFAVLTAECTHEGATMSKEVHWNRGKPPYTKEVVVITTQDAPGEDA